MLNLDNMSQDELYNLYLEIDIHPIISSKKYRLLFRDIKLYKAYAINLWVCRNLIKNPVDYDNAEKYKDICDNNVYPRLSDKAKWK